MNAAPIDATFMQPPQWMHECSINMSQVRQGVLLGITSKAGKSSLNGKSQLAVKAEIGKWSVTEICSQTSKILLCSFFFPPLISLSRHPSTCNRISAAQFVSCKLTREERITLLGIPAKLHENRIYAACKLCKSSQLLSGNQFCSV